jgi:hypothetical protein
MANIELDGSNKTIKVDTGDLTLDVPGEIHFDADGAIIRFKDNGTAIGTFENVSSDFIIKSSVSDKDLIFKGNDGGSAVTALTLDMSDAGKATFNSNIVVSSTVLGASDLNLSSSDSNEKITLDRSGTQRFNVGGSEGMRLTTTGLGIGTSSPLGRIHAKQHSTAYGLVMEANGNDSWLRVHHNDSLGIIETTYNSSAGYSPLTFKTSATERMRIETTGQVAVLRSGQTTFFDTSHKIIGELPSDSYAFLATQNATAGGGPHYFSKFFANGQNLLGSITVSNTATAFNTSSDYRLKENVVTDWDATTRLKQLKPSRFNFIADADTTVDGFLAHEVSDIVPEAISGEKDATETYTDDDGQQQTRPVYQGIDQSKLVPLMVKTIQELEARIKILEDA